MSLKKILFIILFVAVTVGIGYALYATFFRAAVTPVTEPVANVNAPGGALPVANVGGGAAAVGGGALPAPGGQVPSAAVTPAVVPTVSAIAAGGPTVVTPVVVSPAIGASVSKGGTLSYYDRADGKFYRRLADGTVQSLSSKVFYNVDKAVFDPAGNRAVVTYPDGTKTMYDFSSDTQVTLPRHWDDFAWSTQGDRLVAKSLAVDQDSRFLVIASPDGSSARAVQELGANADKVTVAWSPTGQVVALAATGEPCGFDCSEIFLIGQNKENYKTLKAPGLGFIPQWTPTGDQLLFSVASDASDMRPQLWLVDASGDDVGRNRRSLAVNTWADKCTFASDTVAYCGVPRELPRGAGLNRAAAAGLPDDLYRVDITSGLVSRVAVPEGSHDMSNLQVTPDGTTLYFNDADTQFLYSVRLK
jgi:hypothetical protein